MDRQHDAHAKPPGSDFDAELDAIRVIFAALEPLNREARDRVVSFAFRRLGISVAMEPEVTTPSGPPDYSRIALSATVRPPAVVDIRTLKEEKQPSSAREMAVLVAYYLAEAAPGAERKTEVTAEDIKQYFKQAGFKLPRHPDMTLVDTKNAGYLDNGSARGLYRLNPVGYNLIAHSLPAGGGAERGPTRRRGKKAKKSR
jgi:hypothetical protein